eukprot:3637899-Amphidinium_carterae.1
MFGSTLVATQTQLMGADRVLGTTVGRHVHTARKQRRGAPCAAPPRPLNKHSITEFPSEVETAPMFWFLATPTEDKCAPKLKRDDSPHQS